MVQIFRRSVSARLVWLALKIGIPTVVTKREERNWAEFPVKFKSINKVCGLKWGYAENELD